MTNGNGRWQLAFWVISIICTVWLVGLTSGVVTNDRLRVSEDCRIMDIIYAKEQMYYKQNIEIIDRLARIESKIERLDK